MLNGDTLGSTFSATLARHYPGDGRSLSAARFPSPVSPAQAPAHHPVAEHVAQILSVHRRALVFTDAAFYDARHFSGHEHIFKVL